MAGKRHGEEGGGAQAKKVCTDNHRVDDFIQWCKSQSLICNEKVSVTNVGICAQYGMVALQDIAERECLFEIPRSLLLTPQNSSIGHLLEEESESVQSKSGWVPLLIALMHEYTQPTSKWRPYCQMVQDLDDLDLPMFWFQTEVEHELKGTGVPDVVKRDLKNIAEEFDNVVLPFIRKHADIFSPQCQSLDLYKKMVAFVMAYSFTEPLKLSDDSDSDDDEEEQRNFPMMVPMADILNHVARNNAHLDFGKDSLKMIAIKDIKKGDEIFNTYGELSNQHLLHMYGFAEDYLLNDFDVVEIPLKTMLEVVTGGSAPSNPDAIHQRWTYLESNGTLEELGDYLIVEKDGLMNDQVLAVALKVIHMDDDEFQSISSKAEDGWEEDILDEAPEQFTFDNITKLPPEWKKTLSGVASHHAKSYSKSLQEEEDLRSSSKWETLSSRLRYCSHVRYGQLKLLTSLVDACST